MFLARRLKRVNLSIDKSFFFQEILSFCRPQREPLSVDGIVFYAIFHSHK